MLRYFLLALLINYTYSTHYRGGSISWTIRESDYVNGSSTVPVRIYQRHSWRRSAAPSFWSTPLCTAATIADGTALLGEDAFSCVSSVCYTSVSSLYRSISTQVLCTDFDKQYDYASGEKYTTIQLPINQRLLYTYASCCWIGLLPDSSEPGWALNLIIDTNRRLDGKFNNAPVSTMQPLYTVEIGRAYLINIPMADIDGDRLSCRWGNSSAESGGIYLPKGNLQANPCVLTYNATILGYEGVAIVIEDFDNNNQILSSIPLQFIIQIVPLQTTTTTTVVTQVDGETYAPYTEASTPPPPCPLPPEYIGDWSPGACIGVPSNNLTEIRIVVQVPCTNSSTSIVDILTISPTGMTRSNITQDPQYSNRYMMMLQWTPQSSQYGVQQLCVTPRDSNGRTGQTACFNILVDVRSPHFLPNTMSPIGTVLQNQSVWSISTDVDIIPPIDSNVSAVFYKRDQTGYGTDTLICRVSLQSAVYESRTIIFSTEGILWEQGEQYYILLDGGAATINQSCGIQSAPIISTEFWTFTVFAEPNPVEVTSTITATMTSEESTTEEPPITSSTTIPIITSMSTTIVTTTTTTTSEESTTEEPPITSSTTVPTTASTSQTTVTTTTTDSTSKTTVTTTTTASTSQTTVTTTTTDSTSKTTVTTTTTASTSKTTVTTTTTDSTSKTTVTTTTTTTSASLNRACPESLLFGTIKNVTTSDSQRNYSFCFNVNTTFADVTISANTWTPCSIWKPSGAADPLIDLYKRPNNAVLLAQNDDGLSVPEINCYAAVISYRLPYGKYLVVIRNPKCNYGRFEVRLSAETTNGNE